MASEAATRAIESRVSELAAAMRAGGARVGVGELLAAHRALAAVDPASRADAYFALRTTLCSTRAELALFAEAFAVVFAVEEPENPLAALGEIERAAMPRVGIPQTGAADAFPDERGDPVPAAYSDEELLRDKDFATYTDAERALARRLLARIAARSPQRMSRRSRPTRRRREVHDLRATVRASLRHGGELMERRYREPGLKPRRIVLVCDVSGSMAPYARMLLQYLQASVAARARVEAFVFGTRLTRVTRDLAARGAIPTGRCSAPPSASRTGRAAPGSAPRWPSSTASTAAGSAAARSSSILSDGWDRGDPELLGEEMARLRRTAHRLVWLNPLAADPRYEPLTRGMRAALPHVDHLLPGHSIASLESLADLMEEGLS